MRVLPALMRPSVWTRASLSRLLAIFPRSVFGRVTMRRLRLLERWSFRSLRLALFEGNPMMPSYFVEARKASYVSSHRMKTAELLWPHPAQSGSWQRNLLRAQLMLLLQNQVVQGTLGISYCNYSKLLSTKISMYAANLGSHLWWNRLFPMFKSTSELKKGLFIHIA